MSDYETGEYQKRVEGLLNDILAAMRALAAGYATDSAGDRLRPWVCEFCFRQYIGNPLPQTWEWVFQSAVCPECRLRVERDGGYAQVCGGAYACGLPDPREAWQLIDGDAPTGGDAPARICGECRDWLKAQAEGAITGICLQAEQRGYAHRQPHRDNRACGEKAGWQPRPEPGPDRTCGGCAAWTQNSLDSVLGWCSLMKCGRRRESPPCETFEWQPRPEPGPEAHPSATARDLPRRIADEVREEMASEPEPDDSEFYTDELGVERKVPDPEPEPAEADDASATATRARERADAARERTREHDAEESKRGAEPAEGECALAESIREFVTRRKADRELPFANDSVLWQWAVQARALAADLAEARRIADMRDTMNASLIQERDEAVERAEEADADLAALEAESKLRETRIADCMNHLQIATEQRDELRGSFEAYRDGAREEKACRDARVAELEADLAALESAPAPRLVVPGWEHEKSPAEWFRRYTRYTAARAGSENAKCLNLIARALDGAQTTAPEGGEEESDASGEAEQPTSV